MTSDYIIRFFDQRPFEPFTILLLDGRELHVQHPEVTTIERGAQLVTYTHPTRQLEVIDTSMIVSLRTIYPTDINTWTA
jgi:hypothetical protein